MKKIFLLFISFIDIVFSYSQDDWKFKYRSFETQTNDLINTRLEASFDYSHAYLNGNVWLKLKPHFYNCDSVLLDAKGMNIYTVAIIKNGKKVSLKYSYDSLFLRIKLDKFYSSKESYTIYIQYTAKPNEFKAVGSAAITDAKGLYFINPLGKDKNKPIQIWTQGETEGTSVWVPTIDKPNQKTTTEFILTVPSKYVTLSNGKLVTQKDNKNSTRTDTWKMDLPHSPYLFFIGVGDYAIIKDSYKGKEVNYYVEKEYAGVARKIFGLTPEMIAFYEKILGVPFPWIKYDQITARDYVSGAMENTTATLHTSEVQQDARQLVDENAFEDYVSHELFHQWFGDLVTCESWSNLTVNESFANYSEYLWKEYKYGKDAADYIQAKDLNTYLQSNSNDKDLVRFYYKDKEDMFDAVSYHKGGRILHMLRNYLGDDAFFKGLNLYLTTYKFGNGNAHKLRLALEAVSGKDLNWFFNQWYFGHGHPQLSISYAYDENSKTQKVFIEQTQSSNKIFKLPIAIDIYSGNIKTRYSVCIEHKKDTFTFPAIIKPDLINVDGDRILLAEIKDNKTLHQYTLQYKLAGTYADRKDAVIFATNHFADAEAYALLETALKDPFEKIRSLALQAFVTNTPKSFTINTIENIAKTDLYRMVRADAIDVLATLKNDDYKEFFIKSTADSSYSVAGASLEALMFIDSVKALQIAEQLSKQTAKGRLLTAISNVLIKSGSESNFDYIADGFNNLNFSDTKFEMSFAFISFLTKVKNLHNLKKGVDIMIDFKDSAPINYKEQTGNFINNLLTQLKTLKETAGETEAANYIVQQLNNKK